MLSELFSLLMGGNTTEQMSQTVGADRDTTQTALQAALPVLVGAMARQTATEQGTQGLMGILDRNQDGSVLDDLSGLLGNPAAGTGVGNEVLNTLFGGQRPQVESGLSRSTGLNQNQMGMLLTMLAPIVLGFLGKMRQENHLDTGQVAGTLQQQTQQMEAQGMPILGTLSHLLDGNQDGSPVDDVMRMAGGLFGRR